jgi:hypothetical protein
LLTDTCSLARLRRADRLPIGLRTY